MERARHTLCTYALSVARALFLPDIEFGPALRVLCTCARWRVGVGGGVCSGVGLCVFEAGRQRG